LRFSAASILALLLVGLTPASGVGQTLPRVTDPLFGLSYDSTKIRFEDANEVIARCPELVNARWGRRVFLFARSIEPSGTYMVLGGLYEWREAPAKGEKRFETDPKGVLLREQESKCELLGPAREVFEYPVDGVTAETLRSLARDAVARYAAAFGGGPKFLAALGRAKKQADLANAHAGVLREAVRQIGR
jgi:hypothetical protein